MKKLLVSILLLTVFFYSEVAFAQTSIDSAEITWTVKELMDFHEIIYPMWHDAYPSKDYEALKGFVPQIKSNMEALNNAKLPGILRDKETVWQIRLKEFNTAAEEYYSVANTNDEQALLEAAEKLHTGFERMVRVVRPAFKEVDEFHQTLYIIYHKLLPDSKYDEIAGLADVMIAKAEAIVNYPQDRLKKRLGDKIEKYNASVKELYNSALTLKEVLQGNNPDKKKEAIESVHTAYVQLDSLF